MICAFVSVLANKLVAGGSRRKPSLMQATKYGSWFEISKQAVCFSLSLSKLPRCESLRTKPA